MFAPPQRPKIPSRGIADEYDVPPVAAVATVGPPLRHMGFTPEADAAVSARTALDPDFRRVVHGIKIAGGCDRGRGAFRSSRPPTLRL